MNVPEKNCEPTQRRVSLLSQLKALIRLPLPAATILMLITELIEHGPSLAQKLIR
jgi:hypothetical protein